MKYGIYVDQAEHWDVAGVVTTAAEAGAMVTKLLEDGHMRVEAAMIDD